MRSKSIVAIVLLAVVASAGVAVAAGDFTKVTKFKAEQVRPGEVRYSGKIKAKPEDCESKREILIYHDNILIVTGRTDKDGSFSVKGPEPPDGDKVEVKVPKEDGCKKGKKSAIYELPE